MFTRVDMDWLILCSTCHTLDLDSTIEPNIWFADNIKVQYLQFMAHMKTPQYRSNLQQLLEQEKVRADVAYVIMHFAIVVAISSAFFSCCFFYSM